MNVSSTMVTWSSELSTASRCFVKLTIPDGSRSRQTMPMNSARSSARTRTVVVADAVPPAVGSLMVSVSIVGAAAHAASSRTPSNLTEPVSVPARSVDSSARGCVALANALAAMRSHAGGTPLVSHLIYPDFRPLGQHDDDRGGGKDSSSRHGLHGHHLQVRYHRRERRVRRSRSAVPVHGTRHRTR